MTTELGLHLDRAVMATDAAGVFEDAIRGDVDLTDEALLKRAKKRRRSMADTFTTGVPDPVAVAMRASAIRVSDVKRIVSAVYGVSRDELESARRHRQFVVPRQIAMYLARRLTTCSYPQIAREFGGRDHSTAIFAYRKVAALIARSPALSEQIEAVAARIRAERPQITPIFSISPQESNVVPVQNDRFRAMVNAGFFSAVQVRGTVQ